MPYQHLCQNPACNNPFLTSHKRVQCCSRRCARAIQPLKSLAVRFWPRVRICAHGAFCPYCCWEWIGGHHSMGYGVIGIRTGDRGTIMVSRLAHNIMWELINERAIPTGRQINHHCDNPPCCSIWHLYAGTSQDNARDAVVRLRYVKGKTIKLKPAQVLEIRALAKQGHNPTQLGRMFGVSNVHITRIILGESWKHLS
jgi:HNH endonuclease